MLMDGYDERNKELTRVYKRIMSENKEITHAEACKMAVNSQASRWWLGFTYVYRELLRRLKGRSLEEDPIFRRIKKHSPKRIRYYDMLWARYQELSKRREFAYCSTLFLTSFVLNEPAPNFIISESVGKSIIERELRKAREEKRALLLKKRMDDGKESE